MASFQKSELNGHDAVIAIGDVHGHAQALGSIIGISRLKWRNPFFVLLGDLIDGPNSLDVYRQVIELQEQGDSIIINSNHEQFFWQEINVGTFTRPDREKVFKFFGRKRLDQFFKSLKEFWVYRNFFLSHAPVYRYPSPNWIKSIDLHDTYLTSFEQARFARYDFAGVDAFGTFGEKELIQDQSYIGICGHEELEDVVVYPNQYICLDSGIACGRLLSALDLNSNRLIQVNRLGDLIRDEVIDVR